MPSYYQTSGAKQWRDRMIGTRQTHIKFFQPDKLIRPKPQQHLGHPLVSSRGPAGQQAGSVHGAPIHREGYWSGCI